jgi:hypothetical protein
VSPVLATNEVEKNEVMLYLVREKQGNETTLSSLYIENSITKGLEFLCYCLEDKVRAVKIPKVTAIFTGTYPIRFRYVGRLHESYSKRFDFHKGMLEICELLNFRFVMFHIGNDKEDTEGCPLVGDDYRLVQGDFVVLNSTVTYRQVYMRIANLLLQGKKVSVKIMNNPTIKIF